MKRLLAIMLALTLALMLAACTDSNNGTDTPEGITPPSSGTSSPGQTQANPPQGSIDNTYHPPDNGGEVMLAVAKGFDDREIVLRVTVPGSQSVLTMFDDPQDLRGSGELSAIQIMSGDNFNVGIDLAEYPYDTNMYQFIGDPYTISAYFDGDNIIARVYAQEGVWDALNEFHVVISRGVNEGFYFNKSDVEVPLSQILPGVADLRTFGVDRSAVSLNAIDNGDGTLTFTLKDTSAKSMYMYPWSWIDYSDAHYEIYSGMECKWHVAGHLSYDPRSDVAIYSDFGFGRSVGYNTGDSTRPGNWKQMMVDMALEIMGEAAIEPPIDPNSPRAPILDTGPNYNDVSDSLSVTVDENGLTATFTQSFLSGYTLDDVAAFRVVLLYRVSGSAFGHKFIDVEESFGFEVSDVIE